MIEHCARADTERVRSIASVPRRPSKIYTVLADSEIVGSGVHDPGNDVADGEASVKECW